MVKDTYVTWSDCSAQVGFLVSHYVSGTNVRMLNKKLAVDSTSRKTNVSAHALE